MHIDISTIRRRYAAKIARMTPAQAMAAIRAIRSEGVTIHHPTIKALTGGYVSQSINAAVSRRLAERSREKTEDAMKDTGLSKEQQRLYDLIRNAHDGMASRSVGRR